MFPKELQEYLDVDGGLERIRGNKTLYKSLLNSFSSNNYCDQLLAEIASGDYQTAAKTAHAIKGMAGNLSMPALYQAAIALEAGLKSGTPSQESQDNMAAIIQATSEAVATVSAML